MTYKKEYKVIQVDMAKLWGQMEQNIGPFHWYGSVEVIK